MGIEDFQFEPKKDSNEDLLSMDELIEYDTEGTLY